MIRQVGLGLLLGLATAAVGFPSVARAETPKVGTAIAVVAPEPVPWGENPTVTVRLTTQEGQALPNMLLVGALEGDRHERTTDAAGMATFRFAEAEAGHSLTVVVEFAGTRNYFPSSSSVQITIRPPEIVVQAVPSLEGLHFQMGGVEYTTNGEGMVHIPVSRDELGERPTPVESELAPGVSARFSRWFGSEQAGWKAAFDIFYEVGFSFVNLDGEPVDSEAVSEITVESSIGLRQTLVPTEPVWVQGSRVADIGGDLVSKDLYYTIESVIVSGADVVNRAQQQFIPSQTQEWIIRLLFYPADVTVRDAIFRLPTGSSVELEYPNGERHEFQLDSAGRVRIPSLPRGDYQVWVHGAGISLARPLALSRPQEVSLELISYLDIGFVALCGVIAFFGLLLWGRPGLRRFLGSWRDPEMAAERVIIALIIGLLVSVGIWFGPGLVHDQLGADPSGLLATDPVSPSFAPMPRSSALAGSTPTTYVVQPGDTLKSIAARFYGDASRWQDLYNANAGTISNPDQLDPEMELVVPRP
jgi:nucleoid-associated protein YgaU